MASRIGIGVIGAGKHGQRYLNHVARDVPSFVLRAVSRRDVARGRAQAEQYGARFHADWRDLVADPAVDAVVAVVPPTLHRAIAETVVAASKAFLIEKPLATTGADAVAIRDAIVASGIPCLMGHTLRWNAVARTVRELLRTLGPLRALGVIQRFEVSTLDWLDRPEISGGGIILHTGVHSFDLVRFLTGREVTRVRCRTSRIATARTEDNFAAILDLDGSDTLVTASGCRATAGRSGLIEAAAAEGQVVADHQLHFAYRVRGLERSGVDLPPPTQTVREVLTAFARLLATGEKPFASLDDGVRAVQIAEACLRSAAQDGQPIDLAPLRTR
jgi:predicted dehydrogenase